MDILTRLWETLGEDMSDAQKYYCIAVDPHTSKKSCLGFLKLLKKRAERIDHVCGRLIEEMEKEKHPRNISKEVILDWLREKRT